MDEALAMALQAEELVKTPSSSDSLSQSFISSKTEFLNPEE